LPELRGTTGPVECFSGKEIVCAAIQKVGDDTFEIAKFLPPVLVRAILAGTVDFPLIPLYFAGLAVVIARIGIAALCHDVEIEEK
jgi:hypothetical protein